MIYVLDVPGPIEEVEEVRVLEWHGAEGHRFAPGAMVVELETHKALVEVRAGQTGVLRRIVCPEGAWQDVGKTLAVFSDEPDEPFPGTYDDLADLAVEFEVS